MQCRVAAVGSGSSQLHIRLDLQALHGSSSGWKEMLGHLPVSNTKLDLVEPHSQIPIALNHLSKVDKWNTVQLIARWPSSG